MRIKWNEVITIVTTIVFLSPVWDHINIITIFTILTIVTIIVFVLILVVVVIAIAIVIVNVICFLLLITQRKKATIHQLTTMLFTSKNVIFPGHNHLLTPGADDPLL